MINKLWISILTAGVLFSCSTPTSKTSSASKPQAGSSADAPEEMVFIPSGAFTMGGKSDQASPNEYPNHQVEVSAFFMDEHEVTNAQFKAFVDATGYVTIAERAIDWEEMAKQLPPGTPKPADSILAPGSLVFRATEGPVNLRDYSQWWEWVIGANWQHPEGPASSLEGKMNFPVVHIAYDDALAYAEWAGKRLPTEAEWEWASMGGQEGVKYPWGNESVETAFTKANFWQGFFPYDNEEKDGFFGAAPVKSFPANGYGLYDMAGNVWEWCSDKYHEDAYKMAEEQGKVENPKGPDSFYDPNEPYAEKHVVRGGSFLCNDSYCSGYRVARRMSSSHDSGLNHTGFRCVKDI
ncbi:formylglycine-generating enzyme family protein [uncultured Imperialibacter sp.]|uniref:formylglycine-generating enzyme family protein n=1 Tax=uncultured Imperialibacter sp. TaxID=1672639 RepID=UPI0030DC400F